MANKNNTSENMNQSAAERAAAKEQKAAERAAAKEQKAAATAAKKRECEVIKDFSNFVQTERLGLNQCARVALEVGANSSTETQRAIIKLVGMDETLFEIIKNESVTIGTPEHATAIKAVYDKIRREELTAAMTNHYPTVVLNSATGGRNVVRLARVQKGAEVFKVEKISNFTPNVLVTMPYRALVNGRTQQVLEEGAYYEKVNGEWKKLANNIATKRVADAKAAAAATAKAEAEHQAAAEQALKEKLEAAAKKSAKK